MSGRAVRDPDETRLAEAVAWRINLSDIEIETSPDFEAWWNDPENARAWATVAGLWDYLDQMAHAPELVAARQAALSDARRASTQRRAPVLHRRALGAIAAALVVGVGWGAVQWMHRPDDYRTSQGERRIITLADGSRISLDASSEVTVRYTPNARELHLLHGQARFDVTHDIERPFSVVAGEQKIIATGTAFNVDIAGPKVLVTLIEGHVVVVDENPRQITREWPRSVELRAGQQLAAAPTAPPAVGSADIVRVTAWTNGQIMFDNEMLSSVVARVNRYSSTQVVIADPRVATMRISGVLNAGDINGFVDIVTHYLPVRATINGASEIALTGDTDRE